MSDIIVRRDAGANAVFFSNQLGSHHTNLLHAKVVSPDSGEVSVTDTARDIELVSDVWFDRYKDENGVQLGTTCAETAAALNVMFQATGSSMGEVPTITSNTTINVAEGDTVNYELTADYGVGYEWENLPAGVVSVDGNVRKLIGTPTAGTYNMTAKAVNYYGAATETITMVVANPPFSNSKSTQFQQNDYLATPASALDAVLGRSGNGSGSGEAWSISCYFKRGTHTGGAKQTVLFFGDDDYDNGGHIWLYFKGSDKKLRLEYGSKNNNLEFATDSAVFTNQSSWYHVLVTYDGGTTGSSSGQINDYYSRFKIYIDGALVSLDTAENNYGWSGSIPADIFRIGRRGLDNDWMKNSCKLDELALWGSDQSGNVSSIYNGGVPFDLSTLGTSPDHWWRLGDGDTYPTLTDSEGSSDLTMYSMTVASLVNDVP
jgi:hypothetical protein